MSEVRTHACAFLLLQYGGIFPRIFFVCLYVVFKRCFPVVPCHVEQAEADLAHAGVCHVEVGCIYYFLDFLFGWLFTGFVMSCKRVEEFFFREEVFHELRWQFHEVLVDVGAAQTFIRGACHHAVQGMSEFVQERVHLRRREQCRLVLRGLGEVHDQRDVRAAVCAVFLPLSFVFCHPCSRMFAFSRVEIHVEHGQVRAVAVEYFVCLHIGVIDGDAVVFLECYAV